MKKLLWFPVFLIFLFTFSCHRSEKQPLGVVTTSMLLLTDKEGIDDFGKNAASWSGILEYYGDTWEDQKNRGTAYDYATFSPGESPEEFLKDAISRNFELIFCITEELFPVLPKICREFPEQKFAVICQKPLEEAHNLLQFIVSYEEAAFLVGQAMALKAQEMDKPGEGDLFAFLGNNQTISEEKLYLGFIQGILNVNPNGEVKTFFLKDSHNFSSARVKTWFESGIFFVFTTEDAFSADITDVATDLRNKQREVWLCGVSLSDLISANSPILTSVEFHPEIPIYLALNNVKAKKFRGEIRKIGIGEKALEISRRNIELGSEIQKAMDETLSLLSTGNLIIYDNFKDAIENEIISEELPKSED